MPRRRPLLEGKTRDNEKQDNNMPDHFIHTGMCWSASGMDVGRRSVADNRLHDKIFDKERDEHDRTTHAGQAGHADRQRRDSQ